VAADHTRKNGRLAVVDFEDGDRETNVVVPHEEIRPLHRGGGVALRGRGKGAREQGSRGDESMETASGLIGASVRKLFRNHGVCVCLTLTLTLTLQLLSLSVALFRSHSL
jgi:hypothetical protein